MVFLTKSFFVLALFLFPALLAVAQQAPDALRVMSYNIRYATPSDGEDRWELRKERVASLIRYHQPDLLGVQEALQQQLTDLEGALPYYAWHGVGRDDGRQGGEYSAIFYRKDRFVLLDSGTFWLSPSPQKPSKGWDASIIRICSWVKLRDKSSGREFFHFNTHFDHEGVQAREQSAALLAEKIPNMAGEAPVILTGDFNTTPDTKAYATLTGSGLLQDARSLSKTPPYGPNASFSTFDVSAELKRLIDFVFVTDAFEVQQHAVLTDSQGGKYPSDHLPVITLLHWANR
jgi:endonuclease/exonuclease/phosphatase family metal-dependent hydrolase